MTKYFLQYGFLFLLMSGFLIWGLLSREHKPLQVSNPVPTDQEAIEDLKVLLRAVPPNSREAISIQNTILNYRQKEAAKWLEAENPGLLIEALAELKTTRTGRTYQPNYKVRALEATQSRFPRIKSAELPWKELGPINVSGRVRAIIADRSDPEGATWFAASIGGGVWKTTDTGVTWTNQTPDMSTLVTTTLVQSESDPDIFYVGTGMGYGRVVDLEGSGIFKSIDHGETWFQLKSTANGELLEAINRIVVDPTNPDIVIACSNDSFSHLGVEEGPRRSGIYKSIDGGDTWEQVFDSDAFFGPDTDNRVQQIVADPTNFNTLYASVNEVGVIKSIDAGDTWSVSADDFALPSDVGNPTTGTLGLAGISVRTELAISPSDPTRIYAAVERPRGVADLYMSRDAGDSWVLVEDTGDDPNWFNSRGLSGANGSYTAGWFDNTIAVHPYNEDVVFVGGVNMYRIDVDPDPATRTTIPIAWRGANSQGVSVVHPDHHFLTIIEKTDEAFTILNANDGGVAFSEDGGTTWIERRGMNTSQFYGVDKKPGSPVYLGGTQDNGTWQSENAPDLTTPWRHVLGGDGFEAVWNYNNSNELLASSQFNFYGRSVDGGINWDFLFIPSLGRGPFITKIANSKVDPDLVFTIGSNGVARSDNFGETWSVIPIPSNWIGFRPFDNVEVSNADPQVVWISSRLDVDPETNIQGGIHVSNDGGFSFNTISDNLPAELREASGIATSAVDARTAYLLFAGPGEPKIMRTLDLGDTWDDLSGFSAITSAKNGPILSSNGFPDVAVFALLEMPYNPDILWAGTEIGLFVSNNAGQSWQPANNGFPNVAVFELSIVDDEVLVATQGRGVWAVQLPELEGYTPPIATRAPRLRALAMAPNGFLQATVHLPSAFDSTLIVRKDGDTARLDANLAPLDTTIYFPVVNPEEVTYSVVSYKDGGVYRSSELTTSTFLVTSRLAYSNSFDDLDSGSDFVGTEFHVRDVMGFNSLAIHTRHPYDFRSNYTYVLRVPIKVSSSDAILTYDDVVLVEEGISSDYTSPEFFDYVIVEGTKDGAEWVPLRPGYDSRYSPIWSNAYRDGIVGSNSNTPGTEELYVSHTVNLLDTFDPGDEIFIRFRIFSDSGSRGWGWAIDNLSIQPNVVSVSPLPEESSPTLLKANYPNPFESSTTLPFSLSKESYVTIAIIDIQGRKVAHLLQEAVRHAGEHIVTFDASSLASGTYFFRMIAQPVSGNSEAIIQSRSMTLVKQ